MIFGDSPHQFALVPLWIVSVALFSGAATHVSLLLALRPFQRSDSENWMERARLAFPAWSLLGTGPALLMVILLLGMPPELEFENETARCGVNMLVVLAVIAGVALPATSCATRLRGRLVTLRDYWLGLGQTYLLLAPQFTVLVLMLFVIPSQFDLPAFWIIGSFLTLALVLMFGGNLTIARRMSLLISPSARLNTAMAEAVHRHGHHPVAWYLIPMTSANAFAFPFSNVIGVTTTAMNDLSDEELVSVLVHELAHLTEPRPVALARLAGGFAMLPVFLLSPAIGTFGINALLAIPVLMLSITWIAQRVARKMEERSDAAGKTHEGDPGAYARALEKLYRSNLMPAVMGQKRPVHPHLYDRMIEAGVTPDFPRPNPPSKMRSLVAHGFLALLALSFVWGARSLVLSLL